MAYQPIEDYGIIGNMHTAALVGRDGSIDWFCFPHFDSPSVFAAILDHKKGGRFRIAPFGTDVKGKQFYWPETNVLVTRFSSPDGVGELRDYMPIVKLGENGHRWLVRRVLVARGTMKFRMECVPAFNYARDKHEVRFISVTQQIDTSTSHGRMFVNNLLSHAQYERDLISERTRDKLHAARRRGKWTGGTPPLGYDTVPEGGKLVVNEEEAEQVRAIFKLFVEIHGR